MKAGIIAGTAIYSIPSISMEEIQVETPYGSALVLQGTDENQDLIFLPRHGPEHTIPPHKVNYRANIKALEMLGVRDVIAAYAVGSINKAIPPLGLIAFDDFLDFTSGREGTFFDGELNPLKHVDMSEPLCPDLRSKLLVFAPDFGLDLIPRGVYVATNGPRLESPAEIKMFAELGGDVVGMTALPEITLAKELGLCMGAVGFSVNWAAGIEQKINFIDEGLDELVLYAKVYSTGITTIGCGNSPGAEGCS
jgi:5'-methylthioadenosine phosphorylase